MVSLSNHARFAFYGRLQLVLIRCRQTANQGFNALGRNGKSFRIIAWSGRAPYSQISKASAWRTAFPCAGPYHLMSIPLTADVG